RQEPGMASTGRLCRPKSGVSTHFEHTRNIVAQSVEVMYDEPTSVTARIVILIHPATKDGLALPPACGDVAHNATERR
ncbi:MAG TPA: hypothetical protein PK170_08720, partial [Anaerolineae bacterium]|nr:hypothetical protein [Anaerolineae bacterium]